MSFSSLFKSTARDFAESVRTDEPQEIPMPLHLRRGGFIEIDPLPFQMVRDRVNFELALAAQPIAARGANPTWSQALSMPALEKVGIPRTLIVAGGLGHRGRQIHVFEESAQLGKVLDVVERGADFDRITFA